MVGQGAAPAGVLDLRTARTRAAPGLRPAATTGCLPGAWLTDGPRVALVNEKRGRRRKEDAAMARREAPVLSRGSTALKEQWLRHLARHPPSYWRGTKKRDYGVPGARKEYGRWCAPP